MQKLQLNMKQNTLFYCQSWYHNSTSTPFTVKAKLYITASVNVLSFHPM